MRTIDEFKQVLHVLEMIEKNQDHFQERQGLFETLAGVRGQVEAMIEAGIVDEEKRTSLKMAAGIIVLQLAEK